MAKILVANRGEIAVRLSSRLPGRVVRIAKKPGEAVREGEGVLVVEAKGMENELMSPRTGRCWRSCSRRGRRPRRGPGWPTWSSGGPPRPAGRNA